MANVQNGLDQLSLFSSDTLADAGIENPVKKKPVSFPKLKVLKSIIPKSNKIVEFTSKDKLLMANNKEAFSLARELIERPGVNYPFVLFKGESGHGKTFLLTYIFEEWNKRYPDEKFIIMSGVQLLEFISKNPLDLNRLKKIKGVIIDDFFSLPSNVSNSSLLSQIFDLLVLNKKQIIISQYASKESKEEVNVPLSNRFHSSLECLLGSPTSAVIELLCNDWEDFDDEKRHSIIGHPWKNFFQFESFKKKVKWSKQFGESEFDIGNLNKIMAIEPSVQNLNHLVSLMAKYYKVTVGDILSISRKREHNLPRHLLIYYFHVHLGKGVVELGKYFNRDHSSVLYAIKKVKKILKTKGDFSFEKIFSI